MEKSDLTDQHASAEKNAPLEIEEITIARNLSDGRTKNNPRLSPKNAQNQQNYQAN